MKDLEPDLIQALIERDRTAYAQCVTRYKDRVYLVAYQMTGSSEDARDIAQNVFIKLLKSIDSYDRSLPFGAWLHRLTVNSSIDFLRREHKHRRSTIAHNNPGEASPDSPDRTLEKKELMATINNIAANLSPQQRAVFVLRDLQDHPVREIARILNLTESTVRVHLARARTLISEAIQASYPELIGGDQS